MTGLTETRVPMSATERAAEQSLLAEFATFWANAKGDLRANYDTFVADTPIAEGVRLEAVDRDGVRGWWLRPDGAPVDRALLYVHGGGYVIGSATAFRGVASQLTARTRLATFVLDYPIAPEHPFPAGYDNVLHALRWLAAHGVARVAIAGDSAGGGLVLATLPARDDTMPQVVGAVVYSPWTDLTLSGASYRDPATQDALLAREYLADCARQYAAGTDVHDPRVSSLLGVPAGLPPLYLQVGTEELLLDDSRRYAQRAAERGAQVRLEIWEGLHHVFQQNVKQLDSARRANDQAAAFVVGCFD